MYKIICPKCETIQLCPDDGMKSRGHIWFCSHLGNDSIVKMVEEVDMNTPLNIQRIECKIVRIS